MNGHVRADFTCTDAAARQSAEQQLAQAAEVNFVGRSPPNHAIVANPSPVVNISHSARSRAR